MSNPIFTIDPGVRATFTILGHESQEAYVFQARQVDFFTGAHQKRQLSELARVKADGSYTMYEQAAAAATTTTTASSSSVPLIPSLATLALPELCNVINQPSQHRHKKLSRFQRSRKKAGMRFACQQLVTQLRGSKPNLLLIVGDGNFKNARHRPLLNVLATMCTVLLVRESLTSKICHCCGPKSKRAFPIMKV